MTIVPALDLRAGGCVRLRHGDPAQETRYAADPVERARAFVAAGATRLHVVDLDGAFGTGNNLAALRAVCAGVDVPVQAGGGIRTEDDLRARLGAGAEFAVLGTMLVESPAAVRRLLEEFSPRLIAGVDARGSAVAYRGWQVETGLERDAFVQELSRWGFERIVYTEISRDGAGTGYDLDALEHVAALTPLKLTASGGAATLADVQALAERVPDNVDSAIVGRALYEGTLDLRAALRALATR